MKRLIIGMALTLLGTYTAEAAFNAFMAGLGFPFTILGSMALLQLVIGWEFFTYHPRSKPETKAHTA